MVGKRNDKKTTQRNQEVAKVAVWELEPQISNCI